MRRLTSTLTQTMTTARLTKTFRTMPIISTPASTLTGRTCESYPRKSYRPHRARRRVRHGGPATRQVQLHAIADKERAIQDIIDWLFATTTGKRRQVRPLWQMGQQNRLARPILRHFQQGQTFRAELVLYGGRLPWVFIEVTGWRAALTKVKAREKESRIRRTVSQLTTLVPNLRTSVFDGMLDSEMFGCVVVGAGDFFVNSG